MSGSHKDKDNKTEKTSQVKSDDKSSAVKSPDLNTKQQLLSKSPDSNKKQQLFSPEIANEIKSCLDICSKKLDVKAHHEKYVGMLAKSLNALAQIKQEYPRFTPTYSTTISTILTNFYESNLLNEAVFNKLNTVFSSGNPYLVANLMESVNLLMCAEQLNIGEKFLKHHVRPVLFSHGYVLAQAMNSFEESVLSKMNANKNEVLKKFFEEIMARPDQALGIVTDFRKMQASSKDSDNFLYRVTEYKAKPSDAKLNHEDVFADLLLKRHDVRTQLEKYIADMGDEASLKDTISVPESKLRNILPHAELNLNANFDTCPWFVVQKGLTAMNEAHDMRQFDRIVRDVEEILKIKLKDGLSDTPAPLKKL